MQAIFSSMDRAIGRQEVAICNWQASLYDKKTGKWIYGCALILPDKIMFTKNSDGRSDEYVLSVLFEDIIEVKKATTGLIFGAICILTKQNDSTWMSSFSNRDEVYVALHHFWKSQLVNGSSRGGTGSNPVQEQTQMGQKLLKIVRDSEDALSKASIQLFNQGHQISNSINSMDNIHNDLDIAEHLAEDLQSWLGRWTIPKQYTYIDPVFVNKSDVPEIFDFEVLFTKLELAKVSNKQLGTLRLSKDGLKIVTMKMKTEHFFKWSDVSQIKVISPWEIMIIQTFTKPEVTYGLISANMMAALKILEKCIKNKLKYNTSPVCTSRQGQQHSNRETGPTVNLASSSPSTSKNSLIAAKPSQQVDSIPKHNVFLQDDVHQVPVHKSDQIVNKNEFEEISRALRELKSLALAVQDEEVVQNEKLDTLVASVDRANQRLTSTNKKVNKML